MIDIPGVGTVEAKNAASEATLKEILKALGGKSGATAGGAGTGGTSSGNTSPNKAANASALALGKAFNTLGKSVGIAVGGVGKLATGAHFAATTAITFGEKVISAAESLANLNGTAAGVADLFQGIPLVGTAFKAVAGAADDVVKSYTDVSQSGATFSGSILSFSKSASDAGMTMAEFGALIKANGQGMLGFGATTESGAKNFATVSKGLRTTSSELYALGFSTKEINEGLANYGRNLRMQGFQGKKSNDELVSGAKNYLKEMDALAKITGEDRKAKEAEREQLLKDTQFQASMAGLNDKVRDSFLNTVQQLPKGVQGFAKDLLATGTATTAESQELMAMMPASAKMLTDMNAKMQRGEAVTLEERNRLNNLMAKEGPEALKRAKYAAAAGGLQASTVTGLAETQRLQTDAVKAATEEQKKAQENTDKFNEKMQAMQQRISEVANNFKGLLANSGILDVLMSAFDMLANVAQNYLVPVFNIVASTVEKLWNGFEMLLAPVVEYLSNKLGADGLGGTVTWLDSMLGTVFDVLGGTVRMVILAFDGLWDGVEVMLGPLNELWNAIVGTSDSASSFSETLIDVGKQVGAVLRFVGEVLAVTVIPVLTWLAKEIRGLVVGVINAVSWIYSLGDKFEDFKDGLGEVIDALLHMLPNAMGGISDEEKKRRDDIRAQTKLDRETEKERSKYAKEADAQRHKEALAEDKKAFGEKKITSDKLTATAKKEAEARETANEKIEKSNKLDYNAGPEALLKQFAESEGSPLLPSKQQATPANIIKKAAEPAETTKREIEQKGEEKAAAEKKAQDYKKEEEKAKKKFEEEQGTKTPATNQESAETLLAQLNTNMAELIKLTKEQKDLGEKQLSVQRSLTGDLFAAVG